MVRGLLLSICLAAALVAVQCQPPVSGVSGPYGQCFLCPAGVPGPRGPPGLAGLAGRDGRDGRDGECSDSSQPGSGGSSGGPAPTPPPAQTGNLGGAVYTRWGRSECAEGSQLVYAGIAAGAHYTHAGTAANYLCMPEDPIYDEFQTGGNRGSIYSAEYEFNTAITRLRPLHDLTPVCAVCRAPSGRPTQLMIPGRNVCPSDEWRLEYGGYVLSDYTGHKRTEFVCFDREMEAKQGTNGNQDGALFYMVDVTCQSGGGIPCGPYVTGQEVTCAVCTI